MNQSIRKIEIRIFGLTVVTIVIKDMNTSPIPSYEREVLTPWSDLAAAKRQETIR